MKKIKLFVLLGIFIISILIPSSSFLRNAVAEDEELTYTDAVDEDGNINRTYNDFYISSIEENFKAPSGCVLSLSVNEENLELAKDDILKHEYFKDGNQFSMVTVCVFRIINGARMYSESTCTWNVSYDDFTSYVSGILPTLTIYEIEEKISDVDVSAVIEIGLYSSDSNDMVVTFDVEQYHVKKYENGDILNLSGFYYCMDSENRINISAQIDENLFNEKYGFKTDGRVENGLGDGLYYENYLIQYIDKKTNIILDTDDVYDYTPGIELENIPTEPLTIYAVLTFKENGIEYKFYSNDLTLVNPVNGLLIDGFNNRTSIGKGNTHKLTIDFTLMDDGVSTASMMLWVEGSDSTLLLRNFDYEISDAEDDEVEIFDSFSKDFFEFDFSNDEAGEYIIRGTLFISAKNLDYYGDVEFTITVTEEEKSYTSFDEALKIDVNGNIECVAGGDTLNITASIAEDVLNDGEIPTFEWSLSRANVIELDSTDKEKVTVNPIGGGVVMLTVTCFGEAFGSLSRTVVFNVIDDIYSITTLNVPDEFHYSNHPLTIFLSIDKYENVVNFKPEWTVVDKDGNDIEFTSNEDLSITLLSPASNDYTITASYNGVVLDSQIVEVRTINLNVFIKNNIIWIALITLGFVGIIVLLKLVLERKKSLVTKIEKTNKMLSEIDRNSDSVITNLQKVRLSILSDIDYAKNLNMNALNEYEKTIRYLGKSLADIKEITKKKSTMSDQEYEDLFNKLIKDLTKALGVAKEIEDAKEKALKNSYMANENNIAKVDKTK